MELIFDVVRPEGGERGLCPIILLHSLLDSRKTWKRVAPRIANETGRRVYYPDARNHGDSPWSENFTMQILVEDLKEFYAANRIPKAILVGSVMGGYVAMRLALEAPELVEKIVVENMIPDPYPPTRWRVFIIAIIGETRALLKLPLDLNLYLAKMAITLWLWTRLFRIFPINDYEFVAEVLPLKGENNETFEWETNLKVIKSSLLRKDFDLGIDGRWDGEALFLYGTETEMKVGEDERIPVLFPQATRIRVEGSANMTHIEKFEEFMLHVVRFINGPSVPEASSMEVDAPVPIEVDQPAAPES